MPPKGRRHVLGQSILAQRPKDLLDEGQSQLLQTMEAPQSNLRGLRGEFSAETSDLRAVLLRHRVPQIQDLRDQMGQRMAGSARRPRLLGGNFQKHRRPARCAAFIVLGQFCHFLRKQLTQRSLNLIRDHRL